MRFDKTQVQDIEQSFFKEPEIKKAPQRRWFTIGLIVLVLITFILTISLIKDRARLENGADSLMPTPSVEMVPEPTEGSISVLQSLREKWARITVLLNEIDPQQEGFHPPMVDLDLGL